MGVDSLAEAAAWDTSFPLPLSLYLADLCTISASKLFLGLSNLDGDLPENQWSLLDETSLPFDKFGELKSSDAGSISYFEEAKVSTDNSPEWMSSFIVSFPDRGAASLSRNPEEVVPSPLDTAEQRLS